MVTVVDQDSVAAVLERGRGLASACDLAVLDFASFTYPGGSYERGAWGQEQSLCSASFLFNVLTEKGSWYAENRRRKREKQCGNFLCFIHCVRNNIYCL